MSIRVLSSDLQHIAEWQLNEVASQVQQHINTIKHWLSQQQHLNARMDDQWILNFLRGCKFNLPKTKYKLNMFYITRTLMPEIYTNRDPLLPELQEILRLGLVLPLLETDGADAPRAIFVRSEPVDPTRISYHNILKVALMIIDILLNEDDNFVVAGQHVVFDFKGTKISHIFHMNLDLANKITFSLLAAYPTRPQRLHCLNTFSFVDIASTMVQPVLREMCQKRINFYSSSATTRLHEDMSSIILPKEYGGRGASLDELTDHWKNKVETYRDWFFEDAQYGSDETIRLRKRKVTGTAFGVHQ